MLDKVDVQRDAESAERDADVDGPASVEEALAKAEADTDGSPETHSQADNDRCDLEYDSKGVVDHSCLGGRGAHRNLKECGEVGGEATVRHEVEHVDDKQGSDRRVLERLP